MKNSTYFKKIVSPIGDLLLVASEQYLRSIKFESEQFKLPIFREKAATKKVLL